MLCFQCEQTRNETGCTSIGVCSKTPETAALQDLLVYACRGLARAVLHSGVSGPDRQAQVTRLQEGLFATVTNVNFDDAVLARMIQTTISERDALRRAKKGGPCSGGQDCPGAASFLLPETLEGQMALAETIGIQARRTAFGEDIVSLQELLTYGLKGMAAYAHHAAELGFHDPEVDAFMLEGLDALNDPAPSPDGLLALVMRCGEASLKTLALLDRANTISLGHPVPTRVRMGAVRGKAILVSGHDLADLRALLEQTEGTGINVYTHGEMLPAHAYPELRRFPHLAGHFGGAWMLQKREFPQFPGPIVMTTNCLMQPSPEYAERLYSRSVVGWPGIRHLATRDFSEVIAAARALPGFEADQEPVRFHWAGFGHKTVTDVAGTVVEAVKKGDIRRFLLIGGCDGAKPGRNYFTDMAEQAPKDWIILTLGCGKFRLTDLDAGEIAGLPRLLDMGQCNDSYSAIRVAQALAEAFGTDVNALPLSLVVSWYEQKAVTVLLALLHLGIRNIRLGPSLPAFVSPGVLKVLVETFNVMPVGPSAAVDLAAIEGGTLQPAA
ncbi:hydroxylamine reductase [Phaeovibrio sulfidiphilus]|uniref:Hydroxylamine reductase n=1 Tax=Phaeovibrio sulfidiphilus TaxID=1220600 RepID=A0A8J6YPP5_9PROT|nr:hydroxylamine reductase [Phaeovibrio sulfidiphilus]MBE1237376.1 hydroxylamine reductase [Phaeovibrio sulfidiphilus]